MEPKIVLPGTKTVLPGTKKGSQMGTATKRLWNTFFSKNVAIVVVGALGIEVRDKKSRHPGQNDS